MNGSEVPSDRRLERRPRLDDTEIDALVGSPQTLTDRTE
jgi:hypothetical protein